MRRIAWVFVAAWAALSAGLPAAATPESLRLAIEDLARSFPDRYLEAPRFLERLDALAGDPDANAEALRALEREALLANPLLDFGGLLLIKRDQGRLGLPMNWESNSSLHMTGYDNEIAVLERIAADGALKTVFRPPNGEFVGDMSLHFDADRLLVSMPGPNGRWQVFELDADGSNLRQLPLIEEPDVDNYEGCYLPCGDIIFASTATFTGVPCVTGSSHVSNLYRFDRETGAIRRLTFEQDHNWCPTVLPNGRVLYLRWEYSDIPHFASRILFHMNPDGTGQMEYYGSNSYWPNAMFYAKPVPGSSTRFITVVGGHHDRPRMGELVLFDTTLGRHEANGVVQRLPGRGQPVEPLLLDGLTEHSWPKFLHPWPLSDKYFLASAQPTPESRWGVYLVDVFDNMTLIKEMDGYALLEPVPLQARPTPPVIPDRVDPRRDDALVLLSDVYVGDGLKGVPRGTVKQLRLFTYHFAYHGMGGQVNRVGLDGPWDIKRVLGTVPVEPDGSAFFRVPANTPLSIQPLDEHGQALQLMRSWMTAMPGEVVSCVGCHERQSLAPPPAAGPAARRVASDITPWYGPARGFAFTREVQPVLDAFCVECHDGGDPDRPDLRPAPPVHPGSPNRTYDQGTQFTPSYLALRRFVRAPTIESDMHLLPPAEFHADTTELVQMLRKGHHGVEPTPEAWDRIVTWIDLHAPAHGVWHEIVGAEKTFHQRDRRRAMLERYAGIDEDPEDVPTAAVLEAPPRVAVARAEGAADDPGDGWAFGSEEARRRQEEAARDLGGPVERSIALGDGVTLELVLIPAGTFVMGDDDGYADEAPRTRVTIERPFWMGRVEVTNAQFARFDPDHDSRLEHGDFLQFSHEERGYPLNEPDQPVARVSWAQAAAFCRWLAETTGEAFALPSEAEWEWACRAGTDTPLWYGAVEADFAAVANLADVSLARIHTYAPWNLPYDAVPEWRPAITTVDDGRRVSAPVGGYLPNPFGLNDMHGNVWEWTRSLSRPYPYDAGDGREDADTPGARVARGGSWYNRPARARSAYRLAYDPWRVVYNVGFRVMCPVIPGAEASAVAARTARVR